MSQLHQEKQQYVPSGRLPSCLAREPITGYSEKATGQYLVSGNIEQLPEIPVLLGIFFDGFVVEHKTAWDCHQGRTITSPVRRSHGPAADQADASSLGLGDLDIDEANIVEE